MYLSQKPEKWTEAEWRAHQQWLGSRAKHKWPFDFQIPEAFTDTITKLPTRKVLMQRPISPWLQEYERQLQQIMQDKLAMKQPDFYERPLYNSVAWKARREKLKTRPITPYIEEYGEKLRTIAAEKKALREERKAELHPGPHEKWNIDERKKEHESML